MTGRRLILLGLCIALCGLSFSGCAAESSSSASGSENLSAAVASETQAETTVKPTTCQITNPLYYGGKTGDESEAWQKRMSEKYGLTITVNAPVKDTYADYLATNLAAANVKGLFYAGTVSDVLQYKQAGFIQPVGGYLKDNATWNAMPELFRNTYKFNGEIWAIPYSCQYQIPWTRYYRNDWLQKLGIPSVPTTVDGFVSALTSISTKDPDGDGKSETNIGAWGAGMSSWMDLFAACDAVLGPYGSNYVYDYENSVYTDAMTKPGALNAFAILRDLFTKGAVNKTLFTDTTVVLKQRLSAGTTGSAFYIGGQGRYSFGPTVYANTVKAKEKRTVNYDTSQDDWIKATAIYAEATVMTGTKTRNLWAVSSTSGAYCLATGTPQPKETVNFFVDLLFATSENWLTALQGLPENRTLADDGSYKTTYKDTKAKTTFGTPGLVGSVRGKYELEDYLFFLPDTTPLAKARTKEIAAYNKFLRSAEWGTHAYYYLPQQYAGFESATYQANVSAIVQAYQKLCIAAVTDSNTTVEKALADYKKTMIALGGQKALDEANAAIGVTASPVYE